MPAGKSNRFRERGLQNVEWGCIVCREGKAAGGDFGIGFDIRVGDSKRTQGWGSCAVDCRSSPPDIANCE